MVLLLISLIADKKIKFKGFLKFIGSLGALGLMFLLTMYLLYLFVSWISFEESTNKYTDTEISIIRENSELKGFDRGYYAGRRDGKVIICNEIYNEENKPSSCNYSD